MSDDKPTTHVPAQAVCSVTLFVTSELTPDGAGSVSVDLTGVQYFTICHTVPPLSDKTREAIATLLAKGGLQATLDKIQRREEAAKEGKKEDESPLAGFGFSVPKGNA